MALLVGIVGKSGTGKTTAIETLDPSTTYVINCSNKPMSFLNSFKLYNKDNKNYKATEDYNEILSVLSVLNTKEDIKSIVLDDIGLIMSEEFFKRSSESGYTKFSDIGKHMQQIIKFAKTMRDDIVIFFNWHLDDVVDDGAIVETKIKTIGRMLDDKYEPAAQFTTLLFADVSFNKGEPEYGFITRRSLLRSKVVVPAKSPRGMFSENKIPNDFGMIAARQYEYYGI